MRVLHPSGMGDDRPLGAGSVQDEISTTDLRIGDEAARFFERSADLLATLRSDGEFLVLNPAWERLLGWPPAELIGRSMLELVHPEDIKRTLDAISHSTDPDAEVSGFENRLRGGGGDYRWLQWNVRRVADRWYATARDVTGRKWLEEQAVHDLLTGVANRAAITERIAEALARLEDGRELLGLLFI